MTTRAIAYLKNRDIPFEVIKYDHREKGAEFAANAIAFPLEQTVKTLVVEIDHKKHCLALVPGNRQLNLKKLARIFSVKRATMADVAAAERLTGYLVGGISPFGTKRRFPIIIDTPVLEYPDIIINAGQRGMMLKMTPQDIAKAIDCEVAAISR